MPRIDGVNYPGPWEIRLFYATTAAGLTSNSVMRINVDVDTPPDPGSPFEDYHLKSRQGLFYNAKTYVDALVNLLKVAYHTSSNFSHAELWKYQTGTFNADFQSSYSVGVAGTSATATSQLFVSIITFRSQNGGSARLHMVQPVYLVNITDTYPFATASIQDIADFCTNLNSPMIARDGGYLFSALHWMVGQNERMFKVVYRP